MILEGLISTLDEQGGPHVAAMGPSVDDRWTRFELKPYQTSRTLANLRRQGSCVFHVTDDVEAIAAAVCGASFPIDAFSEATDIRGWVMKSACRAYELTVDEWDLSRPRAIVRCNVVGEHSLRDFFGFNRAKHAVVEAAILASRVGLIPQNEIDEQWVRLKSWVDKTGGAAEHRAFDRLTEFVQSLVAASQRSAGEVLT